MTHTSNFLIRLCRSVLTSWWGGALLGSILVLLSIVAFPGRLGKSVRQDPILHIEALISRERYDDALVLIGRLKENNLDTWDVQKVRLQRAVCQMHLGHSEAALTALEAVSKNDVAIADYVAFWQGQCAEALNQPDLAVAAYTRVMNMTPASLMRDDAALRAAALSFDQGHLQEASAHYQTLLDHSTHEVDALAGLVRVLTAQGDSAGARKYRLKLIQDYPDHPESQRALAALSDLSDPEDVFYAGLAYRANKDYRKAAALLKRVISDAPDRLWQGRAQYELGGVYYASREYRTAEHAFERAYQIYQVPKALFELGNCAVKRGQDLAGAKLFLEFAQQFPHVNGAAEALWQAAMAYEREGQHHASRQVFLDLAKTYPKSDYADEAVWRAGFALYQLKQYEAAAQAFLRLARQTPEDYLRDQGYYWTGKCYQKLGKDDEARVWINRAAQGFPTSYYSARARAVLGLTDEVYPAAPDSVPMLMGRSYKPSAYMQKGDVLASIGLYHMAEQEYDRALRAYGNNLFALDDLQQRYERIRSMNRALQVSGQIVTLERRQGMPMTLASFRRLYPTYYWGEINQTAQEVDLDPNLMIAVMRQESAFNNEAESRVGARGLMQVMPATGKIMARQAQMDDFSPSDLYDPKISIRLGGQHLADHMKAFPKDDGRRLGLALSAYNAGLNAARRWSRSLSQQDVDEFVETIPYKETRNYVKLVYRNYQVYSYLQSDADRPAQALVH